jgi:two-component system, LuxR family, sensor kinase FixL
MAIATSRLKLEQSREINPELEALLDAAIDGVVVIDHEGRIKLLSRAAEEMFGCREEELVGQKAGVLVPPAQRSRLNQYIRRYLQAGRANAGGVTRELVAQRINGAEFAAEIALGYVHGQSLPQLVAFVRDVSGRKHSEDALRQSEAALHTAQELANIGNYIIHFDGNAEDYASPQLRRIFGWEPDAPIADFAVYIQAVAHPSDRHRVVQAFTDLYAGGGAFDIEYRILHANTGLRYLHHIAQTICSADGRMLQQMGTVHDITERRLTEYEVRQIQDRLAHFGRISTMGEMAAAIAHEVNQPLAAIATFAQTCERLLARDDVAREELAAPLGQIARQALRAGEIIRRLRSFSRHHEVQFELLKPHRLLEELLSLAQTDTHHHNVRIQLEPTIDAPAIRADALQMQQVLLNLVRNSIEAVMDMPEPQREIILRTRIDEQGWVEFTVADRGRGVHREHLNELFKPFFTTKPSGTGLGLAISASIVRAHGGKLWCCENPGGGTRFLFSIPPGLNADEGGGSSNA